MRRGRHATVSSLLLHNPFQFLAHLFNIPKSTAERCILDAYARAAHDAVEAAFFTQPPSRLSVTLPAFRASRVDLDVIE